jgi:hypothetical protein
MRWLGLSALAPFLLLGGCGSQPSDSAAAIQRAQEASARAETGQRDAGFAWAKKNNETDPEACASGDPEFNEGCLSYVSLALQAEANGRQAAETPQ